MLPDTERHRLLRAIFDRAAALGAAERDAYLERACHGDGALRAHVARLLAAHDAAESFLEHPPQWPRPQDEAPFTGTERFRLIRPLGRGGMGIVFEAHDAQRDELVALKTLRRSGAVDLYRLKREFRSLADVAHPNLVCLYELFVEDERPYFTMELVRGVNFVAFVRGVDRQRLDTGRLSAALLQLAAGVSTLHRRGMLHRDVKPSNVLITTEGRAVLLDFGLIAERHDRGGDAIDGGTPAYMSPEEAAGSAPSEAGDWYGVGATLYEALTGRLPFEGSISDVLRLKHTSDPPSPKDVDRDVPDALNLLCMSLLDRDPARRGGADAILRTLAREPAIIGRQVPLPAPFVGRRDELSVLRDAAGSANRGEARTISISGPSGIGKSALVRHFIAEMRADQRAVILAGRCYENESVPYKGLDGVVDALSHYLSTLSSASVNALIPPGTGALARVFPVLRRVAAIDRADGNDTGDSDAFQMRRRALEALRRLLAAIAARDRLIIWIDDLHWADADSMRLLDELLSPPEPPAMLTVLSFRSEEIGTKLFLRHLVERSGRHGHAALSVGPLTDAEARLLFDALLPGRFAADAEDRRRLTDEAAGSPFVLEQLALYAGDAASASAVAPTLAAMFDARLGALTPQARLFLETLAICGRPMAADVICDASNVAKERHSLIVTLRASHLIRSSGSADRVETYHDRIRQALATRVTPDGRRRIHGRIAASLVERHSDDHEALFEHHHGAGDLDRAAVQAGLAAEKAAAMLAFDRAASFYRLAINLAPNASKISVLKKQLAVALTNAGRPADAAEAYLLAAANLNGAERHHLQRAAAEQFLIAGHIDRGLDQLGDVLRGFGLSQPSSPRRAAARVLWQRARLWWRGLQFTSRDAAELNAEELSRLDACWAAGTGLALVDIVSACGFLTQHLRLALDAGEVSRIAKGMAVEFSARSADWTYRRSARRFEDISSTLSARVATPEAQAVRLLADSIAACATGQWRRAQASSEQSLIILREQCVGMNWETTLAQNMFLWALMYRGQLGELSQRVPALLEDARRRGNLYLATEIVTRSNFVWLAAGDADTGEAQVNEVMAQWSRRGFHRQHYSAMLARMQTALYRGDPATAWQVLEDNESGWRGSMMMQVQALRVEYHFMRGRCALALAALGKDRSRWLAVARTHARRIARQRMRWSTPLGRLLDAGITFVEGDLANAEQALTEAIRQFDHADMQLYANVSRRCMGYLRHDDHGLAVRQQAERWMTDQHIKNPVSLTRMLAPGFTTL